MSVPKLRFKGFEGDWESVTIENCFSLFSGHAFPSDASVSDGIKWLKIADVGIQEMNPTNLSFLPESFSIKFSQFIVSENDYVIALTRPILNKKLKISKVGQFYDGALLNQRVAKIESKENDISFIYALLQKSDIVEKLENSIAGTDPPNLSVKQIKEIVVTIPKICEQTKIASFLSAVDDKIAALRQEHDLWQQYKQGMMQQLFSQTLRFQDDNGQDFPDWEERTLGELGTTYSGLTGKNSDDFGEGVPYITYKQIFDSNKIDISKFELVNISENEKQNQVLKGDVLFTVSSETANEVAFSSVLLDELDKPVYLNSFCFGYRPRNQNHLNGSFARFYFRSGIFRKQVYPLAQGSTRFNISKSALMELAIKLPSLQEQTKIADCLSSIDTKIDVLAQQLEQARVWKQGLLQQMFV